MWTACCHYGSKNWDPQIIPDGMVLCGHCRKVVEVETKTPFPAKPLLMGSGNPNGKTGRRRVRKHHLSKEDLTHG